MHDLSTITATRGFAQARQTIHETDEQTLRDMVDATCIPAPTGSETARATWLMRRLRDCGLEPVQDDVGNVIARSSASNGAAAEIALMAHLDTVFDADTPLDVQRSGSRVTAPGISDNARGLAALLALGRALATAGWPNRAPIVFVGSVGEEGAGDLRGAKHYMTTRGERTGSFIALDGAGAARIIHAGVGSRRLRVRFSGPGGHSWSDWGRPNAVHAAAGAISRLASLPLPAEPRTTLSVGRVGGGTSVNAIPAEAWLEVDLRSEALPPLRDLEAAVRSALDAAIRNENRNGHAMRCDVEVFGDRPAGATSPEHPLVRLARDATLAVGLSPELSSSSTDANVAMAAGVPAIAIGAGGDAGGTHTRAEWYDNTDGARGIERALMIVLAAAGAG